MHLRADIIDGDVPVTMKYPAPGYYYVQDGLGWVVKEWDGRNWWSTGCELPDRGGETVIARIPDLPVKSNA